MRLGCDNSMRHPHGSALFDILGSFGKVMKSLRHVAAFCLSWCMKLCLCTAMKGDKSLWVEVKHRHHPPTPTHPQHNFHSSFPQ